MITTENFHKLIHRAIGKRMMSAAKIYQAMIRSNARIIILKYDYLENLDEISTNDDIDFHDGQEWITIFTYDKKGIAPDYGR